MEDEAIMKKNTLPGDPAMRFSVCMIEPAGYKYSHFLYDSCKYICYTIEKLGYDCCIVKNTIYSDCANIIVGSHNLGDPAMIESIRRADKYIIFQTEILRDDGIDGWENNEAYHRVYLPLLKQAHAVWDVSELNQAVLRRMGIRADIIPRFGYLPALAEITHKRNKDIDFLYYGSMTPHRKQMIEALMKRGGRVVCLFDEAAIFRNDYIARTRVNLAPNQTSQNDHLTARILYLLNNQSIVVVERCRDQDWIEHCFLSAQTDQWVDLCMETLHRPDLPELARRFHEHYKKLDMTGLFQPLIEKLMDEQTGGANMTPEIHSGRDGSAASGGDGGQHSAPAFVEKPVPGLVSVIIVTDDDMNRTMPCIESVLKHTPEQHEIIMEGNPPAWLKGRAKEYKNIRLIENKAPAGPAERRNQGMRRAKGEYILLLDGRAVVSENWLAGLMACLKLAPDAGIVGPRTNGASGAQHVADEFYPSVDELDSFAEQFQRRYRHRQIPCRNLDGFCLLFKHTLAEQIGFFDESLDADHFDVEDFCLRAALSGYRLYVAGDVFIHDGQAPKGRGDKTAFNRKWTLSAGTPEGMALAVLKATEEAATLGAQGKIDQAVETLINAIKVAPDAPEIYQELARILMESKRFAEAWDALATLPENARQDLKTLQYSGYAKEGLNLDDKAADFAQNILSFYPNDPEALNLKGVLAYKAGDKKTAADYFQKAVSANPGYGEAWTNLGVLHWSLEQNEDALACLKKGFMLSPVIADISSLYYSAAASLNRRDEAEADFREAALLYPHCKNIVFLYIDLLIQKEKYHEAIRMIEDALALFGADDGVINAALIVRAQLGPRQIDKQTKKKTLSLCMIVKNEEKNLAPCLKSVRDVVDEIIVVDTGSTDKTKEIACVFGANVYDYDWTGDFSAARNYSLEQARGDWILVLDADEVVSCLDHEELKTLITKRTPSPVAYSIVTRNYTHDVSLLGWTPNHGQYPEEAGPGWMISAKVRLFPRIRDAYFVNPVHELLEKSLENASIPIRTCNVIVHHYGKLDQEREAQKGEDYYRLGKIKYESDPTNAKYIHELAKQALVLEKYEEAVELWLKLLTLIEGKPQSPEYLAILQSSYGDPVAETYTQLAPAYLGLGRYDDALRVARRSMETENKRKEYVHIYALCEIIAGDLGRAGSALEELLRSEPDYPSALFLKALICALEGNGEKAREIFQALKKRRIRVTSLLNKVARQIQEYGQKQAALLVLDAAVENSIHNEETMKMRDEFQAS